MSDATRAEICAVAIAECFRDDGETLMSAFGTTPTVGGRLAKLTFSPDLFMTDGTATAAETVPPLGGEHGPDVVKGAWMPFRLFFDNVVWTTRRHAMMMASQIDRFGNQNFACIIPELYAFRAHILFRHPRTNAYVRYGHGEMTNWPSIIFSQILE